MDFLIGLLNVLLVLLGTLTGLLSYAIIVSCLEAARKAREDKCRVNTDCHK